MHKSHNPSQTQQPKLNDDSNYVLLQFSSYNYFKQRVVTTILPFSAVTLLVGWQEGHQVCKELGVGLLVVTIWLTLQLLQLQLSPSLPSSLPQ